MIDYIGSELEFFQFAVNWKKYFTSNINKYIAGKVLEVGAGFGVNTKYLFTEKVISWTFIEPDRKLASKIPDYTREIHIEKKVVIGTIDNLYNEKFDTIIYIDVLEHIDESKNEICKIKEMLSKGGHLIILVPSFQFLYNEFDTQLGHYRRYDKLTLRKEINSNFKEKELFYLDSIGLFASMANKYFLKKAYINIKQVMFWDKYLVPVSKVIDKLIFRTVGKSLIGVYTNH
jgi:SAM-dependent methyltransferase